MRTDRRLLRPLLVDAPATTALRQSVRARRDLVAHRVAVANQLRVHLHTVFPAAVGLPVVWVLDKPHPQGGSPPFNPTVCDRTASVTHDLAEYS